MGILVNNAGEAHSQNHLIRLLLCSWNGRTARISFRASTLPKPHSHLPSERSFHHARVKDSLAMSGRFRVAFSLHFLGCPYIGTGQLHGIVSRRNRGT